MIDIKKTLVTELNKILPTYYELFVEPSVSLPVITYIETNDYVTEKSNLLEYNRKQYYIKLWVNKISDIGTYCPQITAKLRDIGFSLNGYNELCVDNQVCAIMTFTCNTYEYIR